MCKWLCNNANTGFWITFPVTVYIQQRKYNIVKSITTFDTRYPDMSLSLRLWHILTSLLAKQGYQV